MLNQAFYQERFLILDSGRHLQEAGLDILMDMNGTIQKPEGDYSFEDDVLYGFRNNFSLFLNDLAAASDFFSGLDKSDIPANLEEDENNAEGSVFRARDWILIICFSCAFVVCMFLLINQYAVNRKEMEEASTGSRSSGSRSPCLGIAPRDWSIHMFDEEQHPFANVSISP